MSGPRRREAWAGCGWCAAGLLLSAAACAAPSLRGGGGATDGRAGLEAGVAQMQPGSYAEADTVLRRVAARCESGAAGRRALLLLATMSLDPRYESANPDTAALMSARLLHVPGVPGDERRLAESVYAVALFRGADPGLRPGPDDRGVAHRFDRCDQPVIRTAVTLPVVGEVPESQRIQRLVQERDSLAAAEAAVRGQVAELEAEIARIRRLLRVDTLDAGRPPPR